MGQRPSKWDRYGFTTGMAAAAAGVAAAEFFVSGKRLTEVSVTTPNGRRDLLIDISAVVKAGTGAKATVIKRAGPDRDITDGMPIEVAVVPTQFGYVNVDGGIGIGRVTRPGLALPVGETAVNPVPLAHIKRLVGAKLPAGASVIVSAPEGLALALKTFNPRLGIVGGLSILGTSGLVRPMSLSSWKAALLPQLAQASAMGHKTIALAPGNLGALAAADIGFPETAIAQMGNFAGFMIRAAAKRGLKVVVIGHLGKIVKIACGYENTHHLKTPDRLKLLDLLIKELKPGLAGAVDGLPSAEAAISLLREEAPEVLAEIAGCALRRVEKMAPSTCAGVIITDLSGKVVGSAPAIERVLGDLS